MKRIIAIISASVLLMGLVGMATATTPSTYDWQGSGYPNSSCDAESTTALWIWTGDNPLSLTINGHEQTGSWTQMGERVAGTGRSRSAWPTSRRRQPRSRTRVMPAR